MLNSFCATLAGQLFISDARLRSIKSQHCKISNFDECSIGQCSIDMRSELLRHEPLHDQHEASAKCDGVKLLNHRAYNTRATGPAT